MTGTEAAVLLVILVLATLGTAALFVIGLAGYRRRRTRTYLLLTVVLGLLVVRSVVGIGTVLGLVPMPVHHLIEHSADLTVAALVLYALFQMGSPTIE
ncbi:DUF7471 family protein [Halorientalis pallida]|uniref:DUF7471 family protein n=1 Tax=Halorientalis pallida TaxID=2479928 RepID=UPI002D77FAE6|nr:hypothetical protein [Halorientalis pallida]